MLLVIGLLLIIVTAIIVKLYDEKIREAKIRKQAVILAMLTGLSLTLTGIINLIVK